MKKGIIGVFCVLLGVLALAGEVALLLHTRREHISEHRQMYANELKDVVVKLSASLRMGEAGHFDEALTDFDSTLEKILPYLKENEKEKLADYQTALADSETADLLALNAKILQVKASLKEPQTIDGLESEPELAKLNEVLLRLKTCEVYCSAKEYREIENALTEESAKLNQKVEVKEQENAARLGSEELIEWLDMLK